MPAEHGLILFGKHPAFGDFIAVDTPPAIRETLSAWCDEVFSAASRDCGPDWHALYDNAVPLRFWIGEAVSGLQTLPFAGVLRFSRDKVGRRSPLVLGWAVEGFAPPFEGDDPLHRTAESALLALPDTAPTAADLLPDMDLPDARQIGPVSFWAAQYGDGVPAIAAVDHRAAAARRSYWWTAASGARAGLAVASDGLPDHSALMLLMRGMPMTDAPQRGLE